jgi:hypothetical protein
VGTSHHDEPIKARSSLSGESLTEGRRQVDTQTYIPAVAGYYSMADALSLPVQQLDNDLYNKDAFRAAGLWTRKSPTTCNGQVALAGCQGRRP